MAQHDERCKTNEDAWKGMKADYQKNNRAMDVLAKIFKTFEENPEYAKDILSEL